MSNFFQLLFAGVANGSIYALVALGFVLIYRATNVVNFAQGEFCMLGAYLMVIGFVHLNWPYALAFAVALIGLGVFGMIFNLGVYYPLRNRPFLPVVISTLGASIMMQNGVLAAYGPSPVSLPKILDWPGLQVGGVFLDSQYILIILVTAAMVTLQFLFFEHTLLGKKMQATSQDKDMARLLGIPVARMIAITFIFSAMLGSLAGLMVAPILSVSIGLGGVIALKAFAATIIGGFGDVKGAIVGGIALGIIESLGAGYVSVPYKDAFAFLVLFLFLIVRPQGIYGEKVSEKA